MPVLAVVLLLAAGLTLGALAQDMPKPKMDTLSGVLADYTCASKGKVMMNSWYNATHDDHKTPDGPKPGCATMCLKSLGQPAALFDADKEQMKAVFACNPALTLGDYAAQEVEVTGFWAGNKGDSPRAFVPAKIRAAGGSDWVDVACAQMHGEM
jgi:hypothetical protein